MTEEKKTWRAEMPVNTDPYDGPSCLEEAQIIFDRANSELDAAAERERAKDARIAELEKIIAGHQDEAVEPCVPRRRGRHEWYFAKGETRCRACGKPDAKTRIRELERLTDTDIENLIELERERDEALARVAELERESRENEKFRCPKCRNPTDGPPCRACEALARAEKAEAEVTSEKLAYLRGYREASKSTDEETNSLRAELADRKKERGVMGKVHNLKCWPVYY